MIGKRLRLTRFYATQQLFVKAYGNYLGLFRLGAFVASETGLTLSKVSCFVNVVEKDGQAPGGRRPLRRAGRRGGSRRSGHNRIGGRPGAEVVV